MVGKQIVTKDWLEAYVRKVRQSISGAAVTTVVQTAESITNFVELADVPQSYSGYAGCIVAPNAAATALEFNNYVTVNETAPTLTIRNKTDSAVDPVIQWSLGATPVVKFTAGVDDSDGDAWKLSAGSALGTTDYLGYSANTVIIKKTSPLWGNYALKLQNDLTAHGMTDVIDTKTFGAFADWSADEEGSLGGLYIGGYGSSIWSIGLHAFYTTPETTKTNISWASIILVGLKKSGTGFVMPGANENLVAIQRGDPSVARINDTVWICDADGDTWQTGSVFVNEDANAGMTLGVTINQGAADNEILAFKSSDIAHGMTAVAETDTYGLFQKYIGTSGGVNLTGLTEVTVGLSLNACYVTDDTTKSAAGTAPIMLRAHKKSGAGVAAPGADANIVAIAAYATTVWIVDEDGDTWQPGSVTAEAGLTVGKNGAGGTAGVITLRDGANPGTTATLSYAKWADLEAVNGIVKCNGSGDYSAAAAADLPAHNVLSASHGDSTAAAVVRGDIIIGSGATPKWVRLGKGALGTVLTMGSDEPAWTAPGAGVASFVDLDDVPAAYAGAGGYVVKVKADASGLEFVAGGAGVASFVDLDDVPASYIGQGGKFLKVNAGETAVEFVVGAAAAPANATYITQTANGDLSAEFALGSLATGILKNTTTTGVPTIAVAAQDYSIHRWIHENFDGLATATIVGVGSYNEAGAWASDTLAAGSTAEVTVKSGADKMLTLMNNAAAGATRSTISSTLTTATGLGGGGRLHWKMKVNNNTTGYDAGIEFMDGTNLPIAIYFRYSTTFQFAFYNGAAAKIQDCNKDQWYTFDVFWGPSGSTAGPITIFIDGAWAYESTVGNYSTLWNKFGIFAASPAGGVDCTLDLDDLYVYSAMPLGL